MRLTRRRFLTATTAGLLAPAALCAADAPLVLLAPEGRPYNFTENGALRGMFVDLVREAFRRADLAIDIRLLPWARCMEEVRWGRADGFYVVYKTAEREQIFDFSREPLDMLTETVYIRSLDSFDPHKDFATLRRKRVGILEYTTHGERIRNAIASGAIGSLVSVNGYENLALMLESGRIDVVLAVKDAMNDAISSLKLEDRIRQVGPEIDILPAFLVFTRRRDMSAYRYAYDQSLREMKADGSYQRITGPYRSAGSRS